MNKPVISVLLFFMALFALAGCEKQAPEKGFFVQPLVGLNLRAEPEQGARRVMILPFAASLKKLETAAEQIEIDGRAGRWTRVAYEDKTGWVFDAYVTGRRPELFFRVLAPSGLRLRAKPNVKAGQVGLMPAGHIGTVATAATTSVRIDDIKGRWLRTSFENKTGWFFSGYAQLAAVRTMLEPYNPLVLYKQEMAPRPRTVVKRLKKHETMRIAGFSVSRTDTPADQGPDCGPRQWLVFEHRETKATYFSEFYSERIVSVNSPFPNTLLTNFDGCCGCCPWAGSRLYFLGEDPDDITSISLRPAGSPAGRCSFNALNGREVFPAEEKRLATDGDRKTLFVYRREPRCEVDENSMEFFDKQNITDFVRDRFIVITFEDGRPDIQEFDNKGIPAKYAGAWADARVLDKL